MTADASDSGSKQSNAEASTQKTTLGNQHSQGKPASQTSPRKHPSLSELIKHSDLNILKLSMILVGICLCLFIWSMIELKFKKPPNYYEVLDETQLKRMRALKQPNLNTPAVLDWATEAATTAYTFDFYNYDSVLKEIRPYFTKKGFENFVSALKSAGLIKRVIEKKLIVSAVVTGAPVVMKEGLIVGGIYAWQIQFPMLLTFQSQSDKTDSKVIVTLLIAQVPTIESPKGIGIASFVTGEAVK